jgi:hypothetical protein
VGGYRLLSAVKEAWPRRPENPGVGAVNVSVYAVFDFEQKTFPAVNTGGIGNVKKSFIIIRIVIILVFFVHLVFGVEDAAGAVFWSVEPKVIVVAIACLTAVRAFVHFKNL